LIFLIMIIPLLMALQLYGRPAKPRAVVEEEAGQILSARASGTPALPREAGR
jgi:hypothetical protein